MANEQDRGNYLIVCQCYGHFSCGFGKPSREDTYSTGINRYRREEKRREEVRREEKEKKREEKIIEKKNLCFKLLDTIGKYKAV